MTDRNRVSYLIQSDFDRLEDWCRMVRVIFGVSPYLVGSALERADYRDVDVRMVLPTERFEAYSRGRLDSIRFLNRALSVWGQRETGLPIDFQVQSATEAAADFPSPTCPMGVRDWSAIPTSGVPQGAGMTPLLREPLARALLAIDDEEMGFFTDLAIDDGAAVPAADAILHALANDPEVVECVRGLLDRRLTDLVQASFGGFAGDNYLDVAATEDAAALFGEAR